MTEVYIQILTVLFLIGMGFVAGSVAERRHIGRLNKREAGNGRFLITQLKTYPSGAPGERPPQLIVAEAVVASDYFKSFLANLRRIFGGEVRSYHSLMTRARREATQRVVEQAHSLGYDAICNLRIQTADIGGNSARTKGAAMVAIMASATAYYQQRD